MATWRHPGGGGSASVAVQTVGVCVITSVWLCCHTHLCSSDTLLLWLWVNSKQLVHITLSSASPLCLIFYFFYFHPGFEKLSSVRNTKIYFVQHIFMCCCDLLIYSRWIFVFFFYIVYLFHSAPAHTVDITAILSYYICIYIMLIAFIVAVHQDFTACSV